MLSSDGRYTGHCTLDGSTLDIVAGIVISIAQAPETDAAIVLTDAWLDMQAQQIVPPPLRRQHSAHISRALTFIAVGADDTIGVGHICYRLHRSDIIWSKMRWAESETYTPPTNVLGLIDIMKAGFSKQNTEPPYIVTIGELNVRLDVAWQADINPN